MDLGSLSRFSPESFVELKGLSHSELCGSGRWAPFEMATIVLSTERSDVSAWARSGINFNAFAPVLSSIYYQR